MKSLNANHNGCNRQGAQGKYDTAPKNVLSSEFPDQKNDEDIIKEILSKGDFQPMEVRFPLPCKLLRLLADSKLQMPGRQGATNDSMSTMKSK